VTGASTGIGLELALQLARRGVRVAASARSSDKLAELAALDPNIRAYPLDVTDAAATAGVTAEIVADLGPIDLAILNAGLWHPMGASNFATEPAAQSMAVNYFGVINAIAPLLPAMLARKKGHLALVASVAGFRGMPRSAAYAPTKAALISLAECLKHELDARGLEISIINPGFVETPMTRINRFPMPFIISADDAAARIIRGLEKGKFEISFPWQMVLLMEIARRAPNTAFFWFWRTFMIPKKHD
jgi:short-subunit dehydrogenase